MMYYKALVVFIFFISSLYATTHWKVSNGRITPQPTSPFYLKNPNDLMAFLNQSDFKKKIDEIVNEFSLIKMEVLNHMNKLDVITTDLSTKTSCILNYYLDEAEFFTTTLTRSYMNRLVPGGFRESGSEKIPNKNIVPKCSVVLDLDFSMYFDQLDSVYNRKSAKMNAEEIIWQGFSLSPTSFAVILANNLKHHPTSWKWHTLGSYYWRYKGNAPEAIECSRRAIYLAPRQFKDIPLLSLGAILQQTKDFNDSYIVLNAAIDHEPNIAENQIALGNALFLKSEFNKSMECYETARSLDPIYNDKIEYIKKSIKCFRDLKITLQEMETLLQKIEPDLRRSSDLKRDFHEYHEMINKEQAPISSRMYENENSLPLKQRSQICTTRYDKEKDEALLVCDFVSDLLEDWRMEDFGIDMIHKYVALKRELINTYKVNSLGIYKKIFIESMEMNNVLQQKIYK